MSETIVRLEFRIAGWVNRVALPIARLVARCGIYPTWIERIIVRHGVKPVVSDVPQIQEPQPLNIPRPLQEGDEVSMRLTSTP